MNAEEEARMTVPYDKRVPMEFDGLFPEGAYIVGEVTDAKPGAAGSVDVRPAAA